MRHLMLFISWACFFAANSNAQTTGSKSTPAKPAATASGKTTQALTNTPGGCSTDYFPVKNNLKAQYLETVRSVNNPEVTPYSVSIGYYPANKRTIKGKQYDSYLKDVSYRQLTSLRKEVLGSLTMVRPNRTDRVYIGCENVMAGKNKVHFLVELREILQVNSKITGYYTEVTENYRNNSIVPSTVTYNDIPEYEIEKMGTNSFNARVLYIPSRDEDEFVYYNQELRKDRNALKVPNDYEYRKTSYSAMYDTLDVLGKPYYDVIEFVDHVYNVDASTGKPTNLVSVEHNGYVKGIGLVFRVCYTKRDYYNNSQEWSFRSSFSLGPLDRSEIITMWELVPKGADIEKLYPKSNIFNPDENQIKQMVAAEFEP